MINLTVDGGGTKINVVAFDENYRMLGYGKGNGINSNYETKENVYEHIHNALKSCMQNIECKEIETVYCTMVANDNMFKLVIENMGYVIKNFMSLEEGYTYLLAGGLTDKGYVALSGTGSGALYCNGKNNTLHLGGYGIPVGDDGSGSWIGIKGINAVTRALSGWGEETTLKDRFLEYFNITEARYSVLNALYPKDRSTRALYAKFAELVGKEADSGDGVALNIIKEAGVLMGKQVIGVVNIQRKNRQILSSLDELNIDIFACGGAWKCSKHMFDAFKQNVIACIPHANCYVSKFDPIVGGIIFNMIENKIETNKYFDFLCQEYKGFTSI